MRESGSTILAHRDRLPRGLAFGAIAAVLIAAAGWSGYRLLDPVAEHGVGNGVCHSTGIPDASLGIYTTPYIVVKPGWSLDVRSVRLVDPVNYELVGAGVQGATRGIGALGYPVVDDGSLEAAAWFERVELPARLGSGPDEAVVLALVPVDPGSESSVRAMRVEYRNRWGLPYRVDVGPRFEAMPDCSSWLGEED